MNLLFICSRNQWRSLTAEHVFQNVQGISVRSAGTANSARKKVSINDIEWADFVFVMEKKHQDILGERFQSELSTKQVICLNIPDHYHYMDDELVEMLKESVTQYLPR